MQKPTLTDVRRLLATKGLLLIGGFEPAADDGVPGVQSGGLALLVGNAGPEMFDHFAAERDPLSDLMDDWCRDTVDQMAKELNARAFYPFGKPALPFQRWARRANVGFQSPLGLNMHPQYGLWHAYRALLVFSEPLVGELPVVDVADNPCVSCKTRNCLKACPVSAFGDDRYDVEKCRKYLLKHEAIDCLNEGCKARLACPVGRAFRYSRPQIQFHMAAFATAD